MLFKKHKHEKKGTDRHCAVSQEALDTKVFERGLYLVGGWPWAQSLNPMIARTSRNVRAALSLAFSAPWRATLSI